MTLRRRSMIASLPAALLLPDALLAPRSAVAQSIEDTFVIPDFSPTRSAVRFWPAEVPVPETGYTVPSLSDHQTVVRSLSSRGAKEPYDDEILLGQKLIKTDIPEASATPYEIAQRFHLWRQGKVGATDRERRIYSAYAREWPDRGNPVIMGFFTEATGLRNPRGDTTFWCAAFVSWCIMRARTKAPVNPPVWPKQEGAASAAYRSWGEATTTPKPGDLAVFQRTDTAWAGHIGFVHEVKGDKVMVLGGNQGAQNDYNGGEVNVASYGVGGGGRLAFHSYRTSNLLHERL